MRARLLATAALVGIAGVSDATPARQPSADQLVAKMAATYAAARTYTDRGDVVTTFIVGGRRRPDRKTFQTAFVRPDGFRFEYREGDDPQRAYVIWTEGGRVHRQWYIDEGEIRDEQSLEMAIAGATGVSSGSAHTIPSLLRPGELGSTLATWLTALHLEGTSDIDGHPSWRITASGPLGDPYTLWIDRDSHLLRRILTSHHFPAHDGRPAFDTETTTSYQPHVDEPVADAELRAPPKLEPPAWLGVELAGTGKHVVRTLPDSPAERAGLKAGDTIISIDGHWDQSAEDLTARIRARKIGATVPVAVWRGNQQITVEVTLAARPTRKAMLRALVDKPAPAFSLPAIDGGAAVTLAGLAGHVVVVDFWATWCGPCAVVMPRLDELQKRYASRGLRVIGITGEDPAVVRKFLSALTVSYTIARDPSDRTLADYGVSGLPTLFVIDKAGVVRDVAAGAGDLAPIESTITGLLK